MLLFCYTCSQKHQFYPHPAQRRSAAALDLTGTCGVCFVDIVQHYISSLNGNSYLGPAGKESPYAVLFLRPCSGEMSISAGEAERVCLLNCPLNEGSHCQRDCWCYFF